VATLSSDETRKVVPSQRRKLRHPSRRLRIGLAQAVCAIVGLVLAPLAVRAPWDPMFPSTSTAEVMLALAFSTVGLITIIFSLLFAVVQWVYATFSMRLRKFENQPLTWWVFGLAIGIFVYSMFAAALTARAEQVSWVVPGITVIATLLTLVLMRRVQLEAFTSIQLGSALSGLCAEGLSAVTANYPELGDDDATAFPSSQSEPIGTNVVWHGPPAVLQELNETALVSQLDGSGGRCELAVGVGSFLAPGALVATVTGEQPVDLARVFVTGPDRTMTQDPQFAIRLIVDIGLKSLSPAVNDPATACQSMDALEPILLHLAARKLATGALRDRGGVVVVSVPVPTWDQFLAHAVDDLVVCAAPLPTTTRRLDQLLAAVQRAAPASRKPAVEVRVRALHELSPHIGTFGSRQ